MIFKNSKNSLRFRVKAHIRKHHEGLFEPWHKDALKRFLKYISAKEQWWVVLLFVIIFYASSSLLSDIEFLNFINLKVETSRILVDQRTTNIATIISITLVVVGFLINNLAVKSPLTYKLLFTKSYLYPTIYLTLSTIGCFIIVSTLRDTKIPHFDFSRAVLAGTYLVLGILILIGFLFRTIIQFTNDKVIASMLHEQFINEAKDNIKEILLRRYSREIFMEEVKKAGGTEYGISEAFSLSNIGFDVAESDEPSVQKKALKIMVIRDIDIQKILKFISIKKGKGVESTIFCRSMGLNITSEETNNFIWEKGKLNSPEEKSKLGDCLTLTGIPKTEEDSRMFRKHFDDKIEELSNDGKVKALNVVLESYIDLYTLQMQNQK